METLERLENLQIATQLEFLLEDIRSGKSQKVIEQSLRATIRACFSELKKGEKTKVFKQPYGSFVSIEFDDHTLIFDLNRVVSLAKYKPDNTVKLALQLGTGDPICIADQQIADELIEVLFEED